VEPPALAQLIEFAERSRVGDWSLRSALTRYAQPQPQRVSDVLDLVRRIEFAMGAHRPTVERDGLAVWKAVEAAANGQTTDQLIGMLLAMQDLDRLGDVLAAWADDPASERPDAAVDAVIGDVRRRLDELGVPREERSRPPRQRG
jgi:hypothetical protein